MVGKQNNKSSLTEFPFSLEKDVVTAALLFDIEKLIFLLGNIFAGVLSATEVVAEYAEYAKYIKDEALVERIRNNS